jgi:hypothetical protein
MITKSYYRTFISDKSRNKLKYLLSVSNKTFEGEKIIVILDCWSWDLDYHINETNQLIPLQKEKDHNKWAYKKEGMGKPEIFLPRESLDDLGLLKVYAGEGYKIFVDRILLKQKFFRHQIFQELPDEIKLSGCPVHLF